MEQIIADQNQNYQLIFVLAGGVIIAISAYILYKILNSYYYTSKANEWLLVIRKGECVQKGIGLCTYTWPGDQVVVFPSLINQVNFRAEQVSLEMQGVEVTGMIIWSVYREKDGPFKCFKAFGEDLKSQEPSVANHKLESMAISIIRDKIANLTINDILRNRNKLRQGVKDEMQSLMTGWGMWLETCEVTDVQISSKTLFTNLQTEYREKIRLDSEKILAETTNQLKTEQLIRNSDYESKVVEVQTQSKIFSSEETLKVQKTEVKIFQEKILIETEKQQQLNLQNIKKEQLSQDLQKTKQSLDAQIRIFQNQLEVKEQQEAQKTLKLVQQTSDIKQEFGFECQKKRKIYDLEKFQRQLQIKQKYYTENVLKSMVLDTTENVYKNLKIESIKNVNVGSGKGQNTQDAVGQLIGQIVASYKAISDEM